MKRKLFGILLAAFLAVLVACETVPVQPEPAAESTVVEPSAVVDEVVVPAPVAERQAAQDRRDAIIDYNLQTYNQQAFDSGENYWNRGEADYEQNNDSARTNYISATESYDDVIGVALVEIEAEKTAQVIEARELADQQNARRKAALLYRRAGALVDKAIEARDAERPVRAVAFADRASSTFQLAAVRSRRMTIDGMRAEVEEKRAIVNRYDLSGYDLVSYRTAESNYSDGVDSINSDTASARVSFLAAIDGYDEVIETAIERIVAEKTAEVRVAWNEAVSRDAENRTPALFDRSQVLIRRAISDRDNNRIVEAVVLANRARNTLSLAIARIDRSLRARAEAALDSAEQSIRATENRALELVEGFNSEFDTNIRVEDIDLGGVE